MDKADITSIQVTVRHHIFADYINAEIRQIQRLHLQHFALAPGKASEERHLHDSVKEQVAQHQRIALRQSNGWRVSLMHIHGKAVTSLRIARVVSPPPLVSASSIT